MNRRFTETTTMKAAVLLFAIFAAVAYLPATANCADESGESGFALNSITNLEGKEVLAEPENPANIFDIVDLLGSDDVQVVTQASMALVQHGPDAMRALIESYDEGRNRLEVVRVLARIPDERSARILIEASAGDDPLVAETALGALPGLGETAVAALVDALREDDTRDVAVTALRGINSESKAGDMRPLLIDPDGDIRLAALRVIRGEGEDVLGDIVPLLEDKDREVMKEALDAVSGYKVEGVEDTLIGFLDDSDAAVRFNAAQCLAINGTVKSVKPLVERLKSDSDIYIRKKAAFALGEIGSNEAVMPLIGVLSENNDELNTNVVSALAVLKASEALPFVEEVMSGKRHEWAFLSSARDFYLAVDGPVNVEPWLVYATDEDHQVVTAVIEVLAAKGTSKDERVVKALEEIIDTRDAGLASEAEKALDAVKQR